METLTEQDGETSARVRRRPVLERERTCRSNTRRKRKRHAPSMVSASTSAPEKCSASPVNPAAASRTIANAIMRLLQTPAKITGGSIRLDGKKLLDHGRGRTATYPLARRRHGLPMRDELPEPRHDHRRSDRRHLHHARKNAQESRPRTRRGAAETCRHQPRPPQVLPAPALRRHAPAGSDRDSAGAQTLL